MEPVAIQGINVQEFIHALSRDIPFKKLTDGGRCMLH